VHLSVGLAGVGACVQRGWAGLGWAVSLQGQVPVDRSR